MSQPADEIENPRAASLTPTELDAILDRGGFETFIAGDGQPAIRAATGDIVRLVAELRASRLECEKARAALTEIAHCGSYVDHEFSTEPGYESAIIVRSHEDAADFARQTARQFLEETDQT